MLYLSGFELYSRWVPLTIIVHILNMFFILQFLALVSVITIKQSWCANRMQIGDA